MTNSSILVTIFAGLLFCLTRVSSFSCFHSLVTKQQHHQQQRHNEVLALQLSSSSSETSTPSSPRASVTFIAGTAPSHYGATSPEPNPSWIQVATQLARRLPHFAQSVDDTTTSDGIASRSIPVSQLALQDLQTADLVVVLGVASSAEETKLCEVLNQQKGNNSSSRLKALLCDPTCSSNIQQRQFAGSYSNQGDVWKSVLAQLAPWSALASHQRLLEKTKTLLARKSSEDYIFAVLFVLHALVTPIDVVKSDINPSWEKGVLRNVNEFKTMVDCCGPQIQAALSDPQSKHAIDQLNAVDLRDQVGSYRVIVSNETPQLEDFTLCILQQNNCFQCDSPILTQPAVP